MNWNLVHLAGVAATAWRNGGGSTRELLAWPDAAAWRVRLSVAEVAQDGPFSRFEGVERHFAVLDGPGVRLQVGRDLYSLDRGSAPLRFDGALPAECALLSGATSDFNLMAPPGAGRMARVQGDSRQLCRRGSLVAVYANEGPAVVTNDAGTQTIPGGTLAWQMALADSAVCIQCTDGLFMEVVL